MEYKLMALDMDGTLLNSEKNISETNAAAIDKAFEIGKVVTISTGRAIQGLKKYQDIINADIPVITYNGAMIIKFHSKEVLFHQTVEQASAREVYEKGQAFDTTIIVWSDNKVYVNKFNENTEYYKTLSGLEPIFIEDIEQLITQGITKMLWIDDAQKHVEYQKLLDETLVNNKIVYCTSHPTFLEFVAEGVSKAVALGRLADILGVSVEKTIAVGDGLNDLEMIKFAGLGIAMENGHEDVKAQADYITDTNDHDGVAKAIEKFML